jgi:hypothetical protein
MLADSSIMLEIKPAKIGSSVFMVLISIDPR